MNPETISKIFNGAILFFLAIALIAAFAARRHELRLMNTDPFYDVPNEVMEQKLTALNKLLMEQLK